MGYAKTKMILLLNYLFGLMLLILSRGIFPEKYFSDSETIKGYIPDAVFQFDFLDSFNNTAYFYKLMGFESVLPDWFAGFISYSIPFLLIALVCRQQRWEFNFLTTSLFFVWNVLMAVYLGVYSKELLAFIVIAFLFLQARSWRGLMVGLFLAMLYACFFRIYWLLVIGFFAVNLWSIRAKKGLMFMIVLQFIAAFVVFKMANVATGQYVSEVRMNVNLEREDAEDAATMITNVVDNSSSVHDWMNVTLTWGALLFPFFLLKTAEVQHILFFIFQTVNTLLFIRIARYLLKELPRQSVVERRVKLQMDVALAWCIAYSFIQGAFEPDFGSFAKHQVILIPMWFFLLSYYFKSRRRARFSPRMIPSSIPVNPVGSH